MSEPVWQGPPPPDESQGRGTQWLKLGGATLGAASLVRLLEWTLVTRAFDARDYRSAASQAELAEKYLPPIAMAAMLATGVALLLFARATTRRDLRLPAIVTGALVLASVVVSGLEWTGGVFDWPQWHSPRSVKLWMWTSHIALLAAPVALLAFCQHAWRSMSGGRLALLGLGLAWTGGVPLWELATRTQTIGWLLAGNPWWWLLLIQGAATATFLGLGTTLIRTAGAIERGGEEYYRGWPTVASGLRMYGDAVAWRISVTFIGLFLVFMAAVARSAPLAALFAVILPVAVIIIGMVMLAGLAGYARQPAGSPGVAPAWIAFAGLVMAIAFDLIAAVMLIKVMGGDRDGFIDSAFTRVIGTLSRWALVATAVSIGSLLLSFGLVAARLRRRDVVGKVIAIVAVVVAAAAALALFFLYGPSVRDVGTALLVIIGLLLLVLMVALSYLRLVRTMENAVLDGDQAALPEARVIAD